jgi:hypothetical protein
MKYLPLLNILILFVVPYLVRHEKEHTRIWLLMRQICKKLDIDSGE